MKTKTSRFRGIFFVASLLVFAGAAPAAAQSESVLNDPRSPFALNLAYETGIVKVLYHTYQVGTGGTDFDFVNQGGQEILFPFQRFTATLDIVKKHRLSFLYQPLTIETKVKTRSAVTVDQAAFPVGTELELSYGFPFWRGTYAYLFNAGDWTFALGAALQLRNASISFASGDGTIVAVSQNLGPVPALHLSADWQGPGGFGLYVEATGLYASSSIINGASFEFEGSILDASIRPRLALRNGVELFLNARFLGGSAKGTSRYDSTQWSTSVERYTANYLATGSLTLGVTVR